VFSSNFPLISVIFSQKYIALLYFNLYIMSIEENKTIVLRSFKGFDKGDLNELQELTAPNFVDHTPLPGQVLGVAGAKQASSVYRKAFPDAKVIIEDLIAEKDEVVIRWTGRGLHKGEFLGIPPSGRSVEMRGISIFRVVNGKIAEQWSELNLFDIMLQIGSISLHGLNK
jgi:steroid delta-isomerase-like uncharacterized protein